MFILVRYRNSKIRPGKKNDSGTPYVFFLGEKLSFSNLPKTLDSDRGP